MAYISRLKCHQESYLYSFLPLQLLEKKENVIADNCGSKQNKSEL